MLFDYSKYNKDEYYRDYSAVIITSLCCSLAKSFEAKRMYDSITCCIN